VELHDARQIDAAPEVVWAAILNPEVLKECVPGCESMTGSPEDGFEAVVVQKVGPVKARFTGLVQLSDIVEGRSLTISGEGKGGPAGFAKGGAKVRLDPEDDGTKLSYEVEAKVGGKLAQLGSRLIDGFAKKMADDFFERLQAAVEGPDDEEAGEDAAEDDTAAGDAPAGGRKKGWFKRMIG
jgi:carbon monoxide dehydrogenase subunit G